MSAPPAPSAEPSPRPPTAHFPALDAVRVVATIAIFTFHFCGIAPFHFWTWTPADIEAFIGRHPWYSPALFFSADVGVQAFIYLSMFSLAHAALRRPTFRFGPWLLARCQRIHPPLWVAMAVLILFAFVATGRGPVDLFKGPLGVLDYAANATGVTIVRPLKQIAGAWWFVGMILCAYLVFPVLLFFLRRGLVLPLVCLGTCVTLFAEKQLPGLLPIRDWFNQYDVEFVGMRMMELTLGASLACATRSGHGEHFLARRDPVTTVALVLVAAVPPCLWGMVPHFAPEGPMRGFLLFVAAVAVAGHLPARLLRTCTFLGGPTYLVYLLHHPVIGPCAQWVRAAGLDGMTGCVVTWAALLVVLFLVAIPLDWLAAWIGRVVFAPRRAPSAS